MDCSNLLFDFMFTGTVLDMAHAPTVSQMLSQPIFSTGPSCRLRLCYQGRSATISCKLEYEQHDLPVLTRTLLKIGTNHIVLLAFGTNQDNTNCILCVTTTGVILSPSHPRLLFQPSQTHVSITPSWEWL